MKSSLRIASAALALTLAAGMALPAAAASKPAFSKDETVYAVLEADGSIRSTTSASISTTRAAFPLSPTAPP